MGTIASSDSTTSTPDQASSAPAQNSPAEQPSGPVVVTARYNRFRRRMILSAVAAACVVAAVVTTLVTFVGGGGGSPPPVAAGPTAQLPTVPDPEPVLAALSAQAPAPDPKALAAVLDPLLGVSALGQGVGAAVVDVASGKVLLDQDAGAPVIPASTAKLLTSVAVLSTVDPEQTLETTVVQGSRPGEVVLVGGGDPTLSTTEPSKTYPGAATVADLAKQVTAALPPGTKVSRVVVDGSLFTGPDVAPTWGQGDAPSSYAAPITAVAVDGARLSPNSDARSGRPAIGAGQALAAALGAPQATVVEGTAPAGARALGTVHSAPIARLVEQALSMSDNVLAEALARQVALARHEPASFEGSAKAVVAALKEAGVDVSGVALDDGSGLSRSDRVPPEVLVNLLVGAADGKLPQASAILSGLAVAGYDGTLADRGDAAPDAAPGSVRAKTGTLEGVHALAGTVVTHDGRLLAFAVIADHTSAGEYAAEAALDEIAAALAGCGCR